MHRAVAEVRPGTLPSTRQIFVRRAVIAAAFAVVALLAAVALTRNLGDGDANIEDRMVDQPQKTAEAGIRPSQKDGDEPGSGLAPQGSQRTGASGEKGTGSGTAVSPSKGRIAFVAALTDEIHVMNPDGSDKTLLAPGSEPDWSPDGKQILYSRGSTTAGCSSTPTSRVDPPEPCEVWVMDADGSNQRRLASGGRPDWSPDGRRIAYAGGQGETEIYVMNADGSGSVRLTDTPEYATSPSWSPDGTRIAFTRRESCGAACYDVRLYVMDADGSDLERLSGFGARDPAWSPDGKRIAFAAATGNNFEIITVGLDGSGAQLTDDPEGDSVMDDFDSHPAWMGGDQLVFTHDPDGPTGEGVCYATNGQPHCGTGGPEPAEIHLMNADGSGRVRIGEGRMPTFAP
jgi:Tol biopolymer transport system component